MLHKKGFWLILAAVVLLAGSGFVYYQFGYLPSQNTKTTTQTIQTSRVRRGNIVLSASGSGVLVALNEINLGFGTSGTLASINVKVGDNVRLGDVLATQGNLESMQAAVAQDKIDLMSAQQTLDDLMINLDTSRAAAQLALVTAQTTYNDALITRNSMNAINCIESMTTLYYSDLVLATQSLEKVQKDWDLNFAMLAADDARRANAYSKLYTAKSAYDSALTNYNYCIGKADATTISEADANLAVAKAALAEAQRTVDALKTGPNATELALAQAKLDNAKLALKLSQQNLEKASMVAPMDGVVMSIKNKVGDTVGTATFIVLDDLSVPMMTVYIDESDLNNIGLNYEVSVVFDALPEQTFTGKVVQIEPALTTVQNVGYIKALAELDTKSLPVGQTLPTGLNASVDVIGGKAENVLLVPLEALREIDTNSYAVFVMVDGKPKLTPVTVGLKDLTYAEIKSGVNEGDTVTTGMMETNK